MPHTGHSGPTSLAVLSSANRPTLQDILSNSAPPPWTLSAFMAYLSQNHCLETLEFTMEAERYKSAFADVQMYEGSAHVAQWSQDARDHVASLWQRLIETYILPYGVREVNLPGPVRDRLLDHQPSASPPHPTELDEAVQIVFELMNDSVLLPFLDSAQQEYQQHQQHQQLVIDTDTDPQDSRQGRSRLRSSKDARECAASSSSTGDDASRSPRPSFLQLGRGRKNDTRGRSPSTSTDATDPADRAGLVDDSGSATPPPGEPLTPPTTPPTSDWGFSTSPSSLQRAISVQSAGWKRMSAKLGLSRKNRPSRRNNTSNGNSSGFVGEPSSSSSSPPTNVDLPDLPNLPMPDTDLEAHNHHDL
ncbi:regulator of g protein signaling domain containing protein [Grosmannia clavigera kw1407]|uniref:Regulator of g protein signaling domain containing protein n=1 Tax=Grosmannia clavigera (strain kw1407 / UAMH 11150) TaxID=655863 RepID=F0XTE3_GROCL|nr:regulator of g protein signaling domain containing protein [Grosmannia clavigera kw1407]EFW98985.1 regulator of g protein signaling domain containing protein [Grosmannia clavigera kw1407]